MPAPRTLSAPARPLLRSAIARPTPRSRLQVPRIRLQSTSSNSSSNSSSGASHITTGLASGTAAALVCYGLYTFTPAGRAQRRINQATYAADKTYKDAATKFQQKTPNTQQALDTLRDTAYSYASFIPGGRGYVDTIFNDVDTLRRGHGEEVDAIVNNTYEELKNVSKEELSVDTLRKAADAVRRFTEKLGKLAADGFSDLMENHPQLKEQLGPGVDQLKHMGDRLGPEAKKQVTETWEQVGEVLQGGFSSQNIDKIRQLIQQKTESLKKLRDQTWNEGMEQAKPLLEKNPKINQLVQENADALKQGNATQLFQKVKDSVQQGSTDDLESYIKSMVDQVKQSSSRDSSGIREYVATLPGGSEIIPMLKSIGNLNEQNTDEARQLLEETVNQLKDVLTEQSKKAEALVRNSQQ